MSKEAISQHIANDHWRSNPKQILKDWLIPFHHKFTTLDAVELVAMKYKEIEPRVDGTMTAYHQRLHDRFAPQTVPHEHS